MLRINKKVEYALMALKFIWENKAPGELTSAREICDRFQAPFDTVAKVMQSMSSADILQSSKGIKGGYLLACDLSQITYLELVQVIEKNSTMAFVITKWANVNSLIHAILSAQSKDSITLSIGIWQY